MVVHSEWPRILLLGASPIDRGSSTGTNVTVSNILGDWPADRLLQVFIGAPSESDEILCRGLSIPPQAALLDYHLRRLVNHSGVLQGSGVPVNAGIPLRRNPAIRARAHAAMRFAADASPIRVPSAIRREAHNFAPHIVYSLLGNLRIIGLAQSFADDLNRPLLPHFMDDWAHTLYGSGEFWGWSEKLRIHHISRLMRSAPRGLAISQPMADEYSEEFGIPFTPVANPAADAYFEIPSKAETEHQVIMYVGGLHVGRAQVLADVADALERRRPAKGSNFDVQLVVHCPDEHLRLYGTALRDRPSVRLAGSIHPEEVPSALARADVLLHVESSDSEAIAFTRLSLSTKIPQYLAAGRPVLALAPRTLASSRLLDASGAGVLVSTESEMIAATASLLNDAGCRRALGTRGRAYARRHLSRGAVTAQFREAVRLTAASG